MKIRNKILNWISSQWQENGGFSYIIPLLTAIACFLCALLLSGVSSIDHTIIIIACLFILVAGSLYLKCTGRRLSMKAAIALLFVTGFLLRLNYVLYTDVIATASIRQHDVGTFFYDDYGHAAYIEWFFYMPFTLPFYPAYGQFYHPPLHHFLAAAWMHIFTNLFSFSIKQAASCIQFLTLFYSSCCMIIADRILSALDIRRTGRLVAFSLIAFHPTFIIMAGSINNDILSVLFTLLAIYTTIRWYQSPTPKRILLIALSVGLGMMTKLTVAVVAPPIAAVFLIKFIQVLKHDKGQMLKFMRQYFAFGCVCIPLGMWNPLLKLIIYGIPLTYVPMLPLDVDQYIGFHSVYESLFDFSPHLFKSPYTAWNEYHEYNPIVSIIKSSIFGEYDWGKNEALIFSSRLLLYVNIFLIILSIAAMIFCIAKKNAVLDGGLKFFLISYHLILFVYFIIFCFQYPHTCSMDYRYITPTCVLGSVYIGFMYEHMTEASGSWKWLVKVIRYGGICAVGLFCILASVIYVIYGI